jgi:RNA polymerase sigma factor (sigma-70 family)
MPPPAEGFASRLFLGPALRAQPDRRLVTLVREGYEAAFEEIVRRYGKPLGRYAASIVGNRSEDVTQDAFSKALSALQSNDREIELRPWLFRIVRNTALNDLRDSPPSPEALAEAIAGGANPAEELERREELADLMRRLQALPEPQRAAIVMRELEGLGHEEIAAALGLSGGAARQAIYRARQALRDGAGVLIPLPLLQALLAGGESGVAETAGAAGMGAAGVGGAAGASVALKATAATVLVAGAVGAGVAIKDDQAGNAKAAPARVSRSDAGQAAGQASAETRDTSFRQEGDRNGDGSHRGRGSGEGRRKEPEPGDDHGGQSGSSGRHGANPGMGGGDDRSHSSGRDGGSGSSGGSASGHDDDAETGAGGNSVSGSGPSGSSGSGSGDSGSSGSGLDGLSGSDDGSSGGGGELEPVTEPIPEGGAGSSGPDGGGSGSSDGSGSLSGSGDGAQLEDPS